jgi:hypothetical protein
MNMHRNAASVGPQAVVHLIGVDQVPSNRRSTMKQRPEFRGLASIQIGYCGHVTRWLHNQSAEAEWSDAMLNQPILGPMNSAPRQRSPALSKIAGEAFHA